MTASPQQVPPTIQLSAIGDSQGATVSATVSNFGSSGRIDGQFSIVLPPEAEVVDGGDAIQSGLSLEWSEVVLEAGASRTVQIRLGCPAVTRLSQPIVARFSSVFPRLSNVEAQLGLDGIAGEPGLKKTTLPSGLAVLTKERLDSETVGVAVAVRAGSRDEDDTTSGGSHWLEHAHFLGTDRRPTNQAVFGAIEAVGGEMNASTSWELTDYYVGVPASELGLAVDVLTDMLVDSRFPVEAFERERKVVFEELNRRANTPGSLAMDTFYSNVFRSHPARRLIGGSIDSVRSIPLETILSFRQQRYVNGNMVVAVTGRIKHEDALAEVERRFSRLPLGPWVGRDLAVEPMPVERRDVRISLGESQAHVLVGGIGPSFSHADRFPFIILDSILDRTGRRLASEIRDRRGLATSVGTDYFGLTDVGAWSASATTRPEQVDEVVRLMLAELRKLRDEPVDAAEIESAARSLRGSRQIGEERSLGQARRLARDSALGLLQSTRAWLAHIEQVTPADVQRVARTYLDLDNYLQVVVVF